MVESTFTGKDRLEGSSANDMQVGGSHYASGMQHWDLVERHGLGYLEGCATKYVTRARKKNGLQDIRKARHFVTKLLELYDEKVRVPRGIVPREAISSYVMENELTPLEAGIISLLCSWSSREHLLAAAKDLSDLELQFSAE